MAEPHAQAREEQFLGALLGLAIGDALGRPLRDMTASDIADRYGAVNTFIADRDTEEGQPLQGEISDKSEIVLCLVESLTTNDGRLDPVNINARLGFLVNGPSRQWMSDAVAEGVELAADHDGLVPETWLPEPELAVAVRGVPVGLLHAVGGYDEAALEAEAATASRLTHAGRDQAMLTAEVAKAINRAARFRDVASITATGGDPPECRDLAKIVDLVRGAETFQAAVSGAVGLGGMTDSIGALGGAIAGARVGASGIPQHLIDGLDARIYLTLAAPWFYRTAIRRAGTVIDLRLVE
ncbi:MAG: ADP-ribosylglycohydrolase family protein [Chloroflexia bacterium]|nr:ADP-ribosylglycohydrolase family protein [Chloroflexia bacterium]